MAKICYACVNNKTKKVLSLILVLVIILSFVGCADSATITGKDPFEGCVEYYNAKNHVGQVVTVYGDVHSVYFAMNSNGMPTFINIGESYESASRCTAVIWGEDIGKFNSPESTYSGKTIKVTGTVRLYKGVAQITVTSPSQIEIVR